MVTNRWTNLKHMLTPRSDHEVVVIGGEIYAIGGSNGENIFKTMEIYNTKQDKWTSAPSMEENRAHLAVRSLF